MRKTEGFTLIEICLAVFIALILTMMAIPSIQGLLSERAIKRSFDSFSDMVTEAQNRAITERRAYLIAWDEDGISLRPDQPANKDEQKGIERVDLKKDETYDIELPAALEKDPPKEWIFWPSGTCESAKISYRGADGTWTADYDPLTVRAALITNASH
jgi:type II secretory pathway pseudopilin PulG